MFFYTLILAFFFQLHTTPTTPVIEPLNLTGYWTGITTQDDEGTSVSYEIELHLQDKDGKITGTSIISGHDIHARIEVEGTFKSGLSLMLKDTEIKDNKVKTDVRMEWCLKQYVLLLKRENEEWILEGHWHGKTSFMTCTPGKVTLKKGVERA